eukprot:GHVN01028234.1.p1 GENE.GHVN01028234.1~~GHVN01028234.1.p1  ORF type:complete len:147 (+),score=78.89 GHVN01028234.1:289-729(+)
MSVYQIFIVLGFCIVLPQLKLDPHYVTLLTSLSLTSLNLAIISLPLSAHLFEPQLFKLKCTHLTHLSRPTHLTHLTHLSHLTHFTHLNHLTHFTHLPHTTHGTTKRMRQWWCSKKSFDKFHAEGEVSEVSKVSEVSAVSEVGENSE